MYLVPPASGVWYAKEVRAGWSVVEQVQDLLQTPCLDICTSHPDYVVYFPFLSTDGGDAAINTSCFEATGKRFDGPVVVVPAILDEQEEWSESDFSESDDD